MKNKLLTFLLGSSLLCGVSAHAMAAGETEDLSKYDIDIDVTSGHVYFQSSATLSKDWPFDNRLNECTDTAGIISNSSFLYLTGTGATTNPQVQIMLKEPTSYCKVLAGTYDIYMVMVPNYYTNPANAPETKLKNKIFATLYSHSSTVTERTTAAQRMTIDYAGEKVDTVLLYEDFKLPISYYGYCNFFPYLDIRSSATTNEVGKMGYTRSFAIDRIILKARSIESEPNAVFTGTCGENATYSLDKTTGVLTISGTGQLSAAPQLDNVFKSCIHRVDIKDGITGIGTNVFRGMSCNTVTLPATLKTIGDSAFYNCKLGDIELSEGLQTIGNGAFAGCGSLNTVSLPSTLISIGDCAFSRTNLQEIEIPVNVQTLGNRVFENSNLTTVYWDARKCSFDTTNGVDPFTDRRGYIESFHIGKNVQHIPDSLCYGMPIDIGFSMGENVETIGSKAFANCRYMRYFNVPAATTFIAENAFRSSAIMEINVAADNNMYSDVDGVLFNKDRTSLVYFPNGANKLRHYRIPSQVKSLGQYALADYYPSTLSLPWKDAASIPSATQETFNASIAFYVPSVALNAYRNISPYSAHPLLPDENLPQYIAGTDSFSVFNKLLMATGWADSITAEHDEEYENLFLCGAIRPLPKHQSYQRILDCPVKRRYGFTILAETDSVYEALTGMKAKDITLEHIAQAVEALGMKGEKNDNYTSANNILNLFVSYHLLPVALKYNKLVRHSNEYGYDRYNLVPTINVTEYYETLGSGRRMLKMSESARTGGIRINRYVKLDSETYMDVPEATNGFIPGILIEDNSEVVRNGYVYPIKEPLVYTDVTARKVLAGERMRHDVASLFPELTNNNIRSEMDCALPLQSDYAYLDNMEVLSDSYVYYLSGIRLGWGNYQEDEINIVGKSDVIIKLPPVPVDGEYELRLGYSRGSSLRGVFQCFFGCDRSSLSPCGLPIDMTKRMEYILPGFADTKLDMKNRLTDLQMREKGVMKSANSICRNGITPVRDQSYFMRSIIGKFHLEAGETYYLRLSCCSKQSKVELQLDYLEWVPEEVYANPMEVEDIW